MKYDFTTIMDRKGKDALAVDKIPYKDVTVQEGFSTIPMWVADILSRGTSILTRLSAGIP